MTGNEIIDKVDGRPMEVKNLSHTGKKVCIVSEKDGVRMRGPYNARMQCTDRTNRLTLLPSL